MKKSSVFLIIMFFSFLLSADLIDIYKKGKIKLVPDLNFGKNTNWDEMFYKGIKSIAFASDGSFFATAMGGTSHSVFKFDKDGNFIKKFGRKGRGPGDLYFPLNLSILDNKYLLISEYATSRRISLFDLNGNFVKIIRTKNPVYDVVGLKQGKIAILSESFSRRKNKSFKTVSVYLYGHSSKKMDQIFRDSFDYNFLPLLKYGYNVYINKTRDNHLIIGYSKTGDISISSIDGKNIKKFKTTIKLKKIDSEMKELYFKQIGKKSRNLPNLKGIIKFNKYLPPFEKIIIDSMGNILVFYNNGFEKAKELRFQVYSAKGKYLCDSFFIVDKFKYDLYRWNMKFFKKSIFFIGVEDEKNKIFKINLGKTSSAAINKK